MYEVSCRDLGVADCEFDVMAHSLERLERAVLTHARYSHPDACAALRRGSRLTRAPRPQGADPRRRARGRRRLSAADSRPCRIAGCPCCGSTDLLLLGEVQSTGQRSLAL